MPPGTPAEWLLLDGQQRLTSLTQALTGTGVVNTMDSRGKLMDRRYYVDMRIALEGDDRIDDAVFSMPSDRVDADRFRPGRRSGTYRLTELERKGEVFPMRLLCARRDVVAVRA